MAKIPYSITPRGVTLVVGNKPRSIDKTAINFQKIVDELRKPQHDVELLKELADINTFVARATFGRVQIADGMVRWDSKPVHNVIAERLIQMLREGFDLEPLARFLDRLMTNPVESARDELYLWLESGDCAITPEGTFLAYKKVRGDYKDIHSGIIDNSVGKVVKMDFKEVDQDRNNTCSRGLHFCSFGYLQHFGGSSGDHIMILDIDPADVVAVPKDYKNQKGRAWRYRVVDEVDPNEAAKFFVGRPVVSDYSPAQQVEEQEVGDGDTVSSTNDNGLPTTQAVMAAALSGSARDNASDLNVAMASSFSPAKPTPRAKSHEEVLMKESAKAPTVKPAAKSASKAPPVKRPVKTPPAKFAQPTPKGASMKFEHGGKSFTAKQVVDGIEKLGQRGFCAANNLPRSTVQGWVKKING